VVETTTTTTTTAKKEMNSAGPSKTEWTMGVVRRGLEGARSVHLHLNHPILVMITAIKTQPTKPQPIIIIIPDLTPLHHIHPILNHP
jgi:hypothetical protein